MLAAADRTVEEEYSQTIDFLYGLERFGILLGLENISLLLEKLGNPQRTYPVVHVAGSNGKGSTCTYIDRILREAGLKSALYTSPHLNDFRERIRINGSMISREALIASTKKVRRIYDPERTTFFEFTTAVAFVCIAQAKPDVAVVEVGLGGRLDATNTADPAVTVITDISREHEDYLGVGIASVAREKAGILKPRVPLVTGAARQAAREVILEVAAAVGAPVREFGRDFLGKRTGLDSFTYRSENMLLEDLTVSMPGSHQVKNASLALAAAEELISQGYPIPGAAMRTGIRHAKMPGRFEILRERPKVVIDGAHTPEGMRLLKSALQSRFPGMRPLLLLGVLRDKDYEKLVKIIAPLAREIVCVEPQGDRALASAALSQFVRTLGIPGSTAATIADGFRQLLAKAAEDDLIVATGSLYMIGPVRRACGIADE